jgi:hypothetical protein
MKKVAATSGQSVSLAVPAVGDLRLAAGWIRAGDVTVLNFLSLVLLGEVRSYVALEAISQLQDTSFCCQRKGKERRRSLTETSAFRRVGDRLGMAGAEDGFSLFSVPGSLFS